MWLPVVGCGKLVVLGLFVKRCVARNEGAWFGVMVCV